MKIEKISDTQIRCCLTPEDLEKRQIRLSELAYGSEKARALFRDMMIQAHKQYGFTNDSNIPLMIEAIPTSGNSLTLVITKVEDPEELDTRFAKFSPTEVVADGEAPYKVDGADDIIDIFHKLMEAKTSALTGQADAPEDKDELSRAVAAQPVQKKTGRAGRKKGETGPGAISITRGFRFLELDDVIRACAALHHFYKGESTLYRTKREKQYLLVVHQAVTPEDFNRVCNILSEYGSGEPCPPSAEAFLREHEETVISGNAVAKLGSLIEA